MKKIIVGNWKMNGDATMAYALALVIMEVASKNNERAEVVLCPPSVFALHVASFLAESGVKTGGQDCHTETSGAFTGDISAVMLKNVGCSHVIVGHSERRLYHSESNDTIRRKASRAIESALIPIICVGETLEERESGKADQIVGEQVQNSLPDEAVIGNFVLAYEPVWAIGSGKVPSIDDIRLMHATTARIALNQLNKQQANVSGTIPVLYGGSVKPDNARDIMAIEGVSGVLVGGASLKAEEFCNIIAAA